jgi:hypothetical protein
MVERRRGTHEVLNQAPPLEGYNLFEQDRPLAEAVERAAPGAWTGFAPSARRWGASRAAWA